MWSRTQKRGAAGHAPSRAQAVYDVCSPVVRRSIVSVFLLGALVAYIPLTHMSHFVGKYFAYHAIRWNDTPNTPGSDQEKPILENLSYPVSWAAPHIQGEGKKSWAELATEEQKK